MRPKSRCRHIAIPPFSCTTKVSLERKKLVCVMSNVSPLSPQLSREGLAEGVDGTGADVAEHDAQGREGHGHQIAVLHLILGFLEKSSGLQVTDSYAKWEGNLLPGKAEERQIR